MSLQEPLVMMDWKPSHQAPTAKAEEMQIFVPVEDAPGVASLGLLVPYRCGLACEHGMRNQSDHASGMLGLPAFTPDGTEPLRAVAVIRAFPPD